MAWQHLIVGLVVLASFGHVAWTLMPAAWRRPLALRLLRLPGLSRWDWLHRAARKAGGCGCDGCDAGQPSAPGTPQRIIVVRRKPH